MSGGIRGVIPISAVLVVKNEERNIRRVLDSLRWVDDVVVVDDFSTDRTLEIAKEWGARVFQRKMDIEGRHRNWAIAKAKHDWILSIDGDEFVTPTLAKTIVSLMERRDWLENERIIGINLPMRMFIGNFWVRHPGWDPAYQLRLFDRRYVRFSEEEVHPSIVSSEGKTYTVPPEDGIILHFSYSSFSDLIRKVNVQTDLDARKRIRLGRRYSGLNAVRKFFSHFLKEYTVKGGWRAGLVGLYISFCAGLYQILTWFKMRELDMLSLLRVRAIVVLDRDAVSVNKLHEVIERFLGLGYLVAVLGRQDDPSFADDRIRMVMKGNTGKIKRQVEGILLEFNGVSYEDSLMISDDLKLLQVAKEIGIRAVLLGEISERVDNTLFPPDDVVSSIEEVWDTI